MERSSQDTTQSTKADAHDVHPPTQRLVLCSLRVVPVRSEHFLGRRYVVEFTTTGRARELRVYRTYEQLMDAIAALQLPLELYQSLDRQLLDHGSCDLLNIVL